MGKEDRASLAMSGILIISSSHVTELGMQEVQNVQEKARARRGGTPDHKSRKYGVTKDPLHAMASLLVPLIGLCLLEHETTSHLRMDRFTVYRAKYIPVSQGYVSI
jgi:hypothetical protein